MKTKTKNILQASLFVAKILLKSTPVFTVLFCLIKIITAFVPATTIVLSRNIIDGLVGLENNVEGENLWPQIIMMFSITIIHTLFNDMGMTIIHFIRDKNENFLSATIADKLSRVETMRLEDQDSLNTIHRVMQSQYSITGAFNAAFSDILVPLLTFLSTISVIFYYYPVIAMLYLLTVIPTTVINQKQNEKMFQHSIDSIPEARKKDYYYEILTKVHFAKELRLYNLSGPIKKRFNESWAKIMGAREMIFNNGFKLLNISTLVSCTGYVGLYAYLIYKTYSGQLSIGGLTAFVGSVFVIANCFTSIVSAVLNYQRVFVDLITAVIEFFDWNDENDEGKIPFEDCEFDITFKNVTFRYPNTDKIVLNDLSFTIKSGEKIALVGENGAGKSTIVKLLLRLYEPDEGEILINGVNIRTYDIDSYRKNFSVCFQNVTHYSLSYADNIALSDIYDNSNEVRVINAAKAGGLNDIHKAWSMQLATPLTRYLDESGVELSGGQWQKIGIARAFFRNARLVILDEPSSALDPKAEEQVFNSFSFLCGTKSGLLISHRLSSIMLVDRILFLENGKIKEEGTHHELMKLKGTYAQMYNLQADKYRSNN